MNIVPVSGGGTKLFAAIGVTYPSGSTLTCTNGTKTLTAKTTSGQWVFAIPEAGTWTVTSTANDGSGNSKSQSVSITTEGQSESVELSYDYYIFKSGEGFKNGHTGKGIIGSVNVASDLSYVDCAKSSTYSVIRGYITPDTDYTKYSTLEVEVELRAVDNTAQFGLVSGSANLPSSNAIGTFAATLDLGTELNVRVVKTLPIENYSGKYYIAWQGARFFKIYNLRIK